MDEIYTKKKVAIRNGSKLKWDLTLPDIKAHKKAYHREMKNTFKTVKNQRFLEENGILYLLIPNEERFQKAFNSALKIAGVSYVLALILAEGDVSSREYYKHQNNISKKLFKKNKIEYTRLFENVIRKFGIHVGNIPNGKNNVSWLSNSMAEIKRDTLKQLYSKDPSRFYLLENKLYFLSPLQHFVTKMFLESIKVAGSETALAKALATNDKEEKRYIMAFKRMSFRQIKTFIYYSNLFAEYLSKNRPLFEEDDYAKSA